MRKIQFTALLISLVSCSRPKTPIAPCDEDLGYSTRKMHLANIDFLNEERQTDWYQLYDNLGKRRTYTPAAKCIPQSKPPTVEESINSVEHGIKELR